MKRILVVDDEPDISSAVAEILEMEGYEAHVCANGAEGLEEIERREPDLLLLDMMMPVLDGNGLLKGLAEDGREHRFPIIVMSAAAQPPLRRVHRFLSKPFEVPRLLAAVSEALGK